MHPPNLVLPTNRKMLTTVFLLLQITISFCNDTEKPVVQTPLGTVRGTIQKSFQGHDFAAFEGIPYAKPPIGDRRFEPPEPVEPWEGTWNAAHLYECAQTGMMKPTEPIGDEDCLYVNVYVPHQHLHPDANLDVVVHIHGGAFMYGSGHLYSRPELLMDTDSILVTFNYRLGILGFLSTEDEVVPGNNGMKDQVMALKWVQNNIASFGGNPNSVTLTGLSAGGSSVHLHYLSEMSKGLFHRGFAQSGVALNTFALQKEPLAKARKLAHANGCPTSCTKRMVDCLKQRPYKYLLNPIESFYGFTMVPMAPFTVVVENGPNAFLKRHPYEALRTKSVLDVPLIFSNTADEGYLEQIFVVGDSFDQIKDKWETVAPFVLDYNYTVDPSLWVSTAERVKEYYFGDEMITQDNTAKLWRMLGDRIFYVDAEKAVRLHAQAVSSPVYYYYFSYPGDDENAKFVGHGTDARYFFGVGFDLRPLSDKDLKVSKLLLEMLTSYARTGVPVVDGVEWTPMTGDKLTYLNITGSAKEDVVMTTVDDLAPIKFWTALKLAENENLVSVKDEL